MRHGDLVLEDALALAAKGFKMYPCGDRGEPWPLSAYKTIDPQEVASSNPEMIRAWRAKWRDCGFAILRQ